MKIVFFCGSLEDGKDGVGDYTRRLALKLVEGGCYVGIVAVHDQYVGEPLKMEDSAGLKMLRLPKELSWRERSGLSAQFVDRIGPQWISLQYVGFAYDRYGLPWQMIPLIRRVSRNRDFHLMFHELWCGMSSSAPLKESILGGLQYCFIRAMLNRLKPSKIFTNIERYATKLSAFGAASRQVPVFSNIPLAEKVSDLVWQQVCAEKGLESLLEKPQTKLIAGFFGTIYGIPGFPSLIERIEQAAAGLGLECCMLLIGNSKKEDLMRLAGGTITARIFELGLQSPGIINRAMDLVHFGVVTTPIDGINKSGGAAAWMERGVPMVISGEDATYKGEDTEALYGVFRVQSQEDVLKAFLRERNTENQERLSSVANSYIESLIIKKAAYQVLS
ncbi:MAG: hypothetical protein ACO1NU_12110 [Arcticibacter sp.]